MANNISNLFYSLAFVVETFIAFCRISLRVCVCVCVCVIHIKSTTMLFHAALSLHNGRVGKLTIMCLPGG